MKRVYTEGDKLNFKRHYLATGNATESMLKVNNRLTRKSASVIGHRLLDHVKLQASDWLEGVGVTDLYLATKTREGLEATKIVTSPTSPDTIQPDYPTRHKYLDTAYRLKGQLQPATGGVSVNNSKVVIALPKVLEEPTGS